MSILCVCVLDFDRDILEIVFFVSLYWRHWVRVGVFLKPITFVLFRNEGTYLESGIGSYMHVGIGIL